MTQRGPSKTYKGSEFRHFGCSLTSCVMTWWGHIVERWCLCQDARLQETKHGCITNQTSLFTYESEWKEQLEATYMLCVQRSTSIPKEQIRRPKTKTCQSALKLFTSANPVSVFVHRFGQ